MSSSTQRWPLLRAGFRPGTLKKYDRALRLFLLSVPPHHLRSAVFSSALMDYLLATYINRTYLRTCTRIFFAHCNTVFSALCSLYPQFHRNLPLSRRCLNRWDAEHPPNSHLPAPPALVSALATLFYAQRQPQLALAVLLSYDCLLRNSECRALCPEHVIDTAGEHKGLLGPDDPGSLYITLWSTKTKRYDAVQVSDSSVQTLLRSLARSVPRGRRLFPFSASRLNEFLAKGCAILRVPVHITWHSLRHGQAVHLFFQGVPVKDIAFAGRWAAISSLRTYLQRGRVLLLAQALPPRVLANGVRYAHNMISVARFYARFHASQARQ